MVRLSRIYTRGGDKGETSLGDGSRVPKQSLRVEAFGTVDEANAASGLGRLSVSSGADPDADEMLARIQNALFDLGADLCTPEDGRRAPRDRKPGALRIVAAQTIAKIDPGVWQTIALRADLTPSQLSFPALDTEADTSGVRQRREPRCRQTL